METKTCKQCGRELPIRDFKKNHLSKDGYVDSCNDCVAKKYRKTRSSKIQDFPTCHKGGNPDLASFTPRELIEELKARGYKGKLTIEREIVL